MSTLLSKTEPAARKQHRCEWCGEPIVPGEKHVKNVMIFEGDFQSWRAHKECIHMMNCLQDNDRYYFDDGFQPYEHRRGKKYEQMVAARLMGDEEWRY